MSDEELQAKRRKARTGDAAAAAAVQRAETRVGLGIAARLQALAGTSIYIEGVRINYRGTLREVICHGDGRPGALILQPCQRVSYFQKSGGPQDQYTFVHVGEQLLPYEMILCVGPDGFVGCDWPTVK